MEEKILSTPKERLHAFREYMHMSVRSFEISLGLSNGALKSAKGVSQNVLQVLEKNYPTLNISWLLTGIGDMLIPSIPQQPAQGALTLPINIGGSQVVGDGATATMSASASELAKVRKENEDLKSQNENLRKQLHEKELEVAKLEGKLEILQMR